MDILLYTKYIVVLILVLGLIFLAAYLIRKLGFVPGVEGVVNKKNRLAVTSSTAVDAKRRLILVRRDNKEHLILLGPSGDVVVESDIEIADATSVSEAEDEFEDAEPHVEPKLPHFGSKKPVREVEE